MGKLSKETAVDWPINVDEPKLATTRFSDPLPDKSPTAIPRGLVPAGKKLAGPERLLQAYEDEPDNNNIMVLTYKKRFRFIRHLP